MTFLSTIQNKIDAKVFTRLGSTVTRYPYSSQSVSKWGDATVSYGNSESVTAVPYSPMPRSQLCCTGEEETLSGADGEGMFVQVSFCWRLGIKKFLASFWRGMPRPQQCRFCVMMI